MLAPSQTGCMTPETPFLSLKLCFSICKMGPCIHLPSLAAQMVKNLPANAGDLMFDPWVTKIPWRRDWHPTPVFSPGKPHGQRSLVGNRPRGRREHDRATNAHFTFIHLPPDCKDE